MNEARHRKTNMACSHLYVESKIGQLHRSREENGGCKGLREVEMRCWSMGTKFQLCKMNKF